jgi:hypothetical protein
MITTTTAAFPSESIRAALRVAGWGHQFNVQSGILETMNGFPGAAARSYLWDLTCPKDVANLERFVDELGMARYCANSSGQYDLVHAAA